MTTFALSEHASIVRHDADPNRVAVVLPGLHYNIDLPVLHFAYEVLAAKGWSVLRVRWNPPDDALDEEEQTSWVQAIAQQVIDLAPGQQRLIVTKSLGSLAAPVALENDLPGVWLTPLLHEGLVVDALTASTQPSLLVGGTADPAWDVAKARVTGKIVLEIPGANHLLSLSDDPLGSVEVLRTVTAATWQFVSDLEGAASQHN